MNSKSKYFEYCAQKGITPIRVDFSNIGFKPPSFTASATFDGFDFTSEECYTKKLAEMQVYDYIMKKIGIHVIPSKFNINNLVDSLTGDESYCEMYYKDVEGVHCTIIFKDEVYSAIAPSRSYARSITLQKIPSASLKFTASKSN